MSRRPKFAGPKTYDPTLAQQARANHVSRQAQLLQELGLGDGSDGSSSDATLSDGEGGHGAGAGITEDELEELRTRLAEAEEAARAAERKAASEMKAVQWRARTKAVVQKKQLKQKEEQMMKMCDAMYELEQQIKALGGTPADNYSEQFEEQMNEANHPRGSPSAGAALASQAESKDGDGGGVDPVAMVALKQENKALKRSLADAQAAADQVRELQAQLAEAQAASNEGAAPSGGSPTVDTAALEEARSQARAAEAEKQHLAKQLEEAQEASQRATRDLNVAQKASSDLESRVQSLTAQLASVASGDDAAAAASAAAAEQVAALQAEKSSLEERVQGLEDEVAATRKTAEKLERKVTKARDAAQQQYDLATQLQEELDATKARLDAASSNAGASEGAVADLQAKVAGLEAKVADADERNAALERQLDDAKSAMSAAAGEAEAVLQKQLAQKEQELETARADVKEAQDANNANIEAAQAALATWKEKYTTVKNERKQYKHQLQAVAADMQRLEAELAAKSEEATASQARVGELVGELSSATARAESLSKEAASAEGSATELQDRLQAAEARAAELGDALQGAQADIKRAAGKQEELQAELAATQERAQGLEGQVSERDAKLEELAQAHEVERQQIVTILKAKYTKRVDKWKAKAGSSAQLVRNQKVFCSGMRQSLSSLREEVAADFGDLSAMLQSRCRKLNKAVRGQQASMEDMVAKYRKESRLRKKLHNDLMELRGNIRVYARVRPVVKMEDKAGGEVVAEFPDKDTIAMVNSKRMKRSWTFDHVFKPEHTNSDVFEQCKDLLTSVVDGYNVCIFAYGQTGAGKTHTMEGRPENPGLNARTLGLLFDLSKERAADWNFEIDMSLLEIYNETIADLLATEPLSSKLSVKRGEHGNYVPGLTRVTVTSSDEVLRHMRRGYQTRTTFATSSNEHSSRSHCMLSVHVTASNKHTNMVARGTLHLVDLAGSERVGKSGVTGARLKEAQAINKSLSALGNVIQARATKSSHVPFRDSVLTYLLQDSLSNQSKTLMFVNLSPVSTNADESFCSLNFAARVRTVELGRASKNVGSGAGRSRSSRK